MNDIIYLRKSREDAEKEKRTGEDILAVHRSRLVSLCEAQGHNYIIKEEIVSGDTIAGRPVFQEILYNLLPTGQYDGICVNEISRLGRGNMRDAGIIYETLIVNNINVITPHKTYVPGNRADLRQIRFELFLSREEFEMIRDRLKDGRDASARKGRAGNNICVLGLDSYRGEYKINEHEMETVNIIFNMVAEGKSLKDVADYLNALGRRTSRGKRWDYRAIRWVLNNDHYLGYQTWQGEAIKASHGVLVDPELIYTARSKLQNRDTWDARRNSTYWVRPTCDHCGKVMYGTYQSKKERSGKVYGYHVYVCEGRREKPYCRNQVSAGVIHEAIYENLVALSKDVALQKRLIEAAVPEKVDYTAEIALIQKEIDSKDAILDIVKMDYFSGMADISIYNEAKKVIGGQIKELRARIRELEYEQRKKPVDPNTIIGELESRLSEWENVDNKLKAEIVRNCIAEARWNKTEKTLYVTLRLPLWPHQEM